MSFQQKATAIFFCLLVNVLALQAQPSRVAGAIDSNQRVELRGNAAFHAPPNSDQGPVDPSFLLTYVTLYTLPTFDQQKALSQLLANQQDRSSRFGTRLAEGTGSPSAALPAKSRGRSTPRFIVTWWMEKHTSPMPRIRPFHPRWRMR
jgi:hypothetical protein